MKSTIAALAVAVAGAGTLAAVSLPVQAAPTTKDSVASALAAVRDEARGTVTITKDPATGRAGFVRVAKGGDLMPSVSATTRATVADKATRYVTGHATALGASPQGLQQESVKPTDTGWLVTYRQNHRGVPVFAGELKAHLDKKGALTAVNGYVAPDLTLDTVADFSTEKAQELAKAFVRKDPRGSAEANKGVDTSGLTASSSLNVYRVGAIKGEEGPARLAHVVTVKNTHGIDDRLVIDADNGRLLNRWSNVHEAMNRTLHTHVDSTPKLLWSEGEAFPGTLDQDQQNLLTSTEEVYNLFANGFGRDSWDGKGATMDVRHNRPDNCPNASWNGEFTSYCEGLYNDDVVAHEWGHAYTQGTSGLIYQWQSGALNESMSDVWGETVDLINGREDEPDGDTSVRRENTHCATVNTSEVQMQITAPAEQAGTCLAVVGSMSSQIPMGKQEVVVVKDVADLPGMNETDACEKVLNSAELEGKWAYVDLSYCSVSVLSYNVERTGAAGVVVGTNVPGPPSTDSALLTHLPHVFITKGDGARIKKAGKVEIEFSHPDPAAVTASRRWMIGEDSGMGILRDMWNPTCKGNPGKVTDAQYFCDPLMQDGGGVHYNSGVPNHLYALAVDGGEYNGQTIDALGIDRAATLWWKASSEYLTPSSDFGDMADGLEAACAALIGQPIRKLSLARNTPGALTDPLTAADCASVARGIAATEMHNNGSQMCEFVPLFAQGAPTKNCGKNTVNKTVWSENFDKGLTGWTQDYELAYAGGVHREWTTKTPAGRTSPVAYGDADGSYGQCTTGAGDFSSADFLISPTFTVPKDGISPTLSFNHSIATESTVDAGQVLIKINDGPFQLIDPGAYTFNGPNVDLMAAPNNTNPRAGQTAFSGTDGGESSTEWGTSVIDLTQADVAPGDKVQIRFDVSRDGCGGIDGWLIDDVKVTACFATKPTTTPPTTKPTPVVKVASKTTVAIKPVKPRRGKAFTVVATVKAAGKAATGKVTVKAGKTTRTLTLKAGKATWKVKKAPKAGSFKVAVKYSGNAKTKPSSVTKKVRTRR